MTQTKKKQPGDAVREAADFFDRRFLMEEEKGKIRHLMGLSFQLYRIISDTQDISSCVRVIIFKP